MKHNIYIVLHACSATVRFLRSWAESEELRVQELRAKSSERRTLSFSRIERHSHCVSVSPFWCGVWVSLYSRQTVGVSHSFSHSFLKQFFENRETLPLLIINKILCLSLSHTHTNSHTHTHTHTPHHRQNVLSLILSLSLSLLRTRTHTHTHTCTGRNREKASLHDAGQKNSVLRTELRTPTYADDVGNTKNISKRFCGNTGLFCGKTLFSARSYVHWCLWIM